jgi:hypothetical protein
MKYLPALLSIISFPVMAATGQFTVDAMLQALIYIVIVGAIFWLVWWAIGYAGIPEPFNKVLRIIVGLIAVVVLIQFLLRYI